MRQLKDILTGALTLIDYSATNYRQVQKKTLPHTRDLAKTKNTPCLLTIEPSFLHASTAT
jgi:hypothetical protein